MTRRRTPSPAHPFGADTAGMRAHLLAWYDANRRDLPWRRTADPYAIWVSEVMLQQTTVAAVLPYYARFLAEFPDVAALAAAPVERVLELWSGLGYYRRARRMQSAALRIVAGGAATLPRSVDELRALPGVGAYTASAIASIAFGAPAAVVDGNVRRVLARVARIDGPATRGATARELARLAEALLDSARPGDWNQAVMELGATVCTTRAPSCAACPWVRRCGAHRAGSPERWPSAVPRPDVVHELRGAVLCRDRSGRVLLARVPEGQPNGGLWEVPAATLRRGPAPTRWGPRAPSSLVRALARDRQLRVVACAALGHVRHAITCHRITTYLLAAELLSRPRGRAWRWVSIEEAPRAALTGEARKLIDISSIRTPAGRPRA